jgi:hypothetical protein
MPKYTVIKRHTEDFGSLRYATTVLPSRCQTSSEIEPHLRIIPLAGTRSNLGRNRRHLVAHQRTNVNRQDHILKHHLVSTTLDKATTTVARCLE